MKHRRQQDELTDNRPPTGRTLTSGSYLSQLRLHGEGVTLGMSTSIYGFSPNVRPGEIIHEDSTSPFRL